MSLVKEIIISNMTKDDIENVIKIEEEATSEKQLFIELSKTV